MKYEVEILEDASEFIRSLPVKMRSKIKRTIDLLREFGYALPMPHSKKLKGIKDLHELRVKVGNDICRLFYFHFNGKLYIITSGYIKKDDETDVNEIEKAITIMKRYKEQNR